VHPELTCHITHCPRARASAVLAFFPVDTVTLRRIYVPFVLELESRHVHVLGSPPTPMAGGRPSRPETSSSISTSARRLSSTSCGTGQFTAAFDAVLADTGIEVLKTPARSPRANAHAERFVLTARTELTDRMPIFGERHLRHVLTHRALPRATPTPQSPAGAATPDHPIAHPPVQRVTRRTVLGGLINEYQPAA